MLSDAAGAVDRTVSAGRRSGPVSSPNRSMVIRLLDAPDLTKISPMGRGAADGVAKGSTDNQIEVGSIGTEWVIAVLVNFFACLPPAVLTAHNAGIETFVDARAGANTALWRLDCDPIAGGNATNLGSVRMELNLRMPRMLAQTGQATVLALAEKGMLSAG